MTETEAMDIGMKMYEIAQSMRKLAEWYRNGGEYFCGNYADASNMLSAAQELFSSVEAAYKATQVPPRGGSRADGPMFGYADNDA